MEQAVLVYMVPVAGSVTHTGMTPGLRRVGTLACDIMHGSVNRSRGRGRPKRTRFDDIKDWSGRSIVDCLRASKDREYWRHIVNSSKCPNGRHA